MWLINVVKVAAIWLCDLINKCYDPFKQATLPVVTDDLARLEAALFSHLQTVHVVNGSFAYEIPMPEDEGDYALFQGLYLAMLAFRGAMPSQIAQALISVNDLFRNNILIRGFYPDGTPNDTTSNDSATGIVFGLWAINDRELAQRWAQKICDSGYALTDLAGKPTKFGQLDDGWKTDPLRITLLLAILALGGPSLKSHYDKLYKKYKLLLKYPKVKLLWWDTDYDTHRAAIHLHVLWDLTRDSIYLDGLRRIHRIMRKSNNAWVETLCAPAVDFKDVNLSMLSTFTYTDRVKGTLESLNDVDSIKWGNKIRARQTLPMNRRGSQEFFWQRNMFSKDEWIAKNWSEPYHSGLDFLICYWLAVRQGLLGGK